MQLLESSWVGRVGTTRVTKNWAVDTASLSRHSFTFQLPGTVLEPSLKVPRRKFGCHSVSSSVYISRDNKSCASLHEQVKQRRDWLPWRSWRICVTTVVRVPSCRQHRGSTARVYLETKLSERFTLKYCTDDWTTECVAAVSFVVCLLFLQEALPPAR